MATIELRVDTEQQALNLELFLKYINKKYDFIKFSQYGYNYILIDSNNTKFFFIDLNDNWKDIKKSIDKKMKHNIIDCTICNDKREFDRFIYCNKCNKEICLTCAIIYNDVNNNTFKCPFCRKESKELNQFLNGLVGTLPDKREINVSYKCECGRRAEDGSTTCSRFPACQNRVFYP